MKQFFLTTAIGLLFHFESFAQTLQPGVVKEYNEKLSKTDLGDVEIVISNASSTTSDSHGAFMLQFRTLKPGDKVNVRHIEKLGYEIFNKEALEQWFISRDGSPFTIIMCKSDRFKRIRDNYSRVSSASYEKQLKKEEAKLAEERESGKLKEAEYEEKLRKLNDEYDQQLNNLDNYVDRFARIDLSELSESEARIIELVQRGKIDKAIELYEAQGLEDKYKQQVAIVRMAEAAIDTLTAIKEESFVSRDSLFASILRKNEMLKLAGGRENFEKVSQSLRMVVLADCTNLDAVWEYATYSQQQLDFQEAITYYEIFIKACNDRQKNTMAMLRLADTYMKLKRFEDCTVWIDRALFLARELYFYDSDSYQELLAQVLVCKGNIFYEQNLLKETVQLFDEAYNIYEKLSQDSLETHVYALSKILSNQGNLYRRMRQFDRARDLMAKSLEYSERLFAVNPSKYRYDLATTFRDIGLIYKNLNNLENSERNYKEALKHMEILFQFNPKAFREEFFKGLSNIGTLYKNMKRYEEAETYYLKALAHADTLNHVNTEAYAVYLGSTLLNMGNLYNKMNRYNDALHNFEKSRSILMTLYNKNQNAFVEHVFSVNLSLGNVCLALKDKQKSLSYFLSAEIYGERAYSLNPNAFCMHYFMVLKNIGIVYTYLEDTDQAAKYNLKAYDFISRLYQEKPEVYENEYISTCYVLGDFYQVNEKKDDAVKYYKKVMEIGQGNSKYSSYVEKAKKAFVEMGIIFND